MIPPVVPKKESKESQTKREMPHKETQTTTTDVIPSVINVIPSVIPDEETKDDKLAFKRSQLLLLEFQPKGT
jgi:hypothetical protein